MQTFFIAMFLNKTEYIINDYTSITRLLRQNRSILNPFPAPNRNKKSTENTRRNLTLNNHRRLPPDVHVAVIGGRSRGRDVLVSTRLFLDRSCLSFRSALHNTSALPVASRQILLTDFFTGTVAGLLLSSRQLAFIYIHPFDL